MAQVEKKRVALATRVALYLRQRPIACFAFALVTGLVLGSVGLGMLFAGSREMDLPRLMGLRYDAMSTRIKALTSILGTQMKRRPTEREPMGKQGTRSTTSSLMLPGR